MKQFIKSTKDATIYTDYKNQNTGIDQILSVFKTRVGGVNVFSRALIEFDLTEVSSSIASGQITNPKFTLKMSTTALEQIPSSFDINILPLSSSWECGLGKRPNSPQTTDGVSYNWRDFVGGLAWSTLGGDYYTDNTSSFSFDTQTLDVNADVTNIVNAWIDGTIPNNGFIVKLPDSIEADNLYNSYINFFSSETNTIYRPKLQVEWDDTTISTGSLNLIDREDLFLTISNLKKEYKVDHIYKFRIKARELFPQPTFSTTSPYSIVNYIPLNSYYSVVDNVTGDIVIPFNEYSKISVDTDGSYFNLNFNGWESERFYRVVIKIVSDDGSVQYIDNKFTFNLVE